MYGDDSDDKILMAGSEFGDLGEDPASSLGEEGGFSPIPPEDLLDDDGLLTDVATLDPYETADDF